MKYKIQYWHRGRQKSGPTLGQQVALPARLWRNRELWLLVAPAILVTLVFRYYPMYGAVLAFKDYDPFLGILRSPWVGLGHFQSFLRSFVFARVIANTVLVSAYSILLSFPFAVLLALMLNSSDRFRFRKTVQMVTYTPYFISTVVMVTIIVEVLHPRTGMVTEALRALGVSTGNIMGDASLFRSIYVLSGVWQTTGYSSIIYLAALSSIDPSQHEAAIMDGATKLQRIKHIDVPSIAPTMIILLILSTGHIMNVGFEKAFLMQNPLNLRTSEVIQTFVYKVGLIDADFSFATAIGLFNSVVNMVMLITMNSLMKRVSDSSLF